MIANILGLSIITIDTKSVKQNSFVQSKSSLYAKSMRYIKNITKFETGHNGSYL
jgi:hypothetical protein